MKITLDLPDWVDEKHIYVFAGIELAAYKYKGEKWKIKTSRCNQCGKCCMNFKKKTPYPPTINGRCIYLKKEADKYICSLGVARPFFCGMPQEKIKDCTETYAD